MRLIDADELEAMVKRLIELTPTADPVKHARWIDVNGDGSLWQCSLCGEQSCCKGNYCMDCGAMMDEEDDHDDHL
jgi:hypothetical protein